MILKMLVKDYKRKKVITIVLFVFMLLAATLAASGTQMFLALTGSMDNLFKMASTPHYTQFHNGTYDEEYVRQWTRDSQSLKNWGVHTMLYPADVKLFAGGSAEEIDIKGSALSFITQNKDIDVLLDLNNQPVFVSDGTIAVPVIFTQWTGLKAGDTLKVSFEGYEKTFVISSFTRDALLGSTKMTVKRFVVSSNDYAEIKNIGAGEYNVFSFMLEDENQLTRFTKEFQTSDMPQNDFFVDIALCRMAYGTGDGVIIGIVLLCSVLLVLIAFLTLRYTILSTIEEDFREIGVMKAIGFTLSGIIRFYMSKYIFLASAACGLGLILGWPLSNALNTELLLYFGTPDTGLWGMLASVGSAALILVLILLFCLLTLRRIGRMTVIDAIRLGNAGETYSVSKLLALSNRKVLGVNGFIGLKEILIRPKTYALLFIVYMLCTFIYILPINVKNTLAEPEVLNYMGYPVSDIIVYGGLADADGGIEHIANIVENDADVTKWAIFTEEQYKLINADGNTQYFKATVGDQTLFPPAYSSGSPPVLPNEIALTYLLAKDLEKGVGDSIMLEIDGEERHMLVSGIYSDTSNGGRAIRSCMEQNPEAAFFWTLNVNIEGDVTGKISEYQKLISNATFSTKEEISDRYMGDMVAQMDNIGILLAGITMLVSALITALFIKMLAAKEVSQIAVMKSLGFTHRHIRVQYTVRIGVILLTGLVAGTLCANVGGEKIMSAVMAMMGATVIELAIKPMQVYIILPLILLTVVYVTLVLGCQTVRKISISQINAE